MRNLKSILVIAFVSLTLTSCNDDDAPVLEPAVSNQAINIPAPQIGGAGQGPVSGAFTKFSFKSGTVVTDASWDIAFRGTDILVNGGSKIGLTDEPARTANGSLAIETGAFESILEAPEDANFKQDATDVYALPIGSGNGWYTYNRQNNVINPISGKVIVVKTNDGHYAKMEIISYYKDLDASNPRNGRFYTFNYVYNPNLGDKSL
ncbi:MULTISPECIES: HmuY family protein [unclassified Polaribacter]|uniref:HmuY family protein n=1 Tax=unclassified Polaribacter TaxID=196858 RepID=UPI0011BD8201|nr:MULTISPECIES: HmuY family protein [unclassified Polaribacter]TXD54434.1 hypothetical protein ES043_00880 [Polaribacter sp. IC063]TXD60347.1 hypothetical protein ES044_07710 [Polaribacter sp. IC066]